MLEILIGKDWTANTMELMQRIARDVSQKKPNRILLVPELISHDTERMLCRVAGDTTSRFAEVLSFSRLAKRVAAYNHVAIPACMDNGGRIVVMAAAARQLHGELKAFASVETKPEFLSMMVDAVDEFKRCGICAEDLEKASRDTHGELAQKMHELALLLQTYDALCANGMRDPRDLMNWVLEELEDSDFASEHVLYMDAFPDLTVQHMSIIEHFIRFSPHVTVSLNCDRVESGMMAFEKAGKTAAQLIKLAKQSGVEYSVRTVAGRNDVLAGVREKLFQGRIQKDSRLNPYLHTVIAPSIHRECQAVAQHIRKLVREGCRYRDIAVVCPQMDVYRAVLGKTFRRYDLPFYLAGTDAVLENPALSTVFAALSAALGGFEQKNVLHYLRGVLSPLDEDTCDLVENYAVVWNVNGAAWRTPWENHPDGFSGKWTDRYKEQLYRVERGRCEAIAPLDRLQRRFAAACKLSEQVDALFLFFSESDLLGRMELLAEQMEAKGDNRSAQILVQLWDILLNALQQLRDALGDTVWDAISFQRLLSLLISQYHVGTIPTVLDAIHVGPVSAMRCQQPKHLIVIGCEEGSLPGYSGSTGILSDGERDALRALDLPLTGGALDGIQAEFAEVYGVFCGAHESISLYCSGVQPSYVFRRLAAMTDVGQVNVTDDILPASVFDAAGELFRWGAAEAAEGIGVGQAYDLVSQRCNHQIGLVSRENINGLYGSKLHLSASQVDAQASCRMHYFLRYGLRLRERKEAQVDPAEFGTYVHYVLEHTVRDVMAQGGFQTVSAEQTVSIAHAHAHAYEDTHFSTQDSQRLAYQFARNMQELDMIVRMLWDELNMSDYLPTAFELEFGDDAPMDAIQIPGASMPAQLGGFVDRVDTFKQNGRTYFRVVDYKTGQKSFDLCDVFNGIGLQMLLYMYALEQSAYGGIDGCKIAAGVQYFSARAPYERVDAGIVGEVCIRQSPRKGMLLDDDLSLAAMDKRDDAPTLGLKTRKGAAPATNLADGEQLKLLREYVFKLLASLVDQIASGKVDPNPYYRGSEKNICSFCPYAVVCHKDSVADKRNYKAIDPQRFWEEIRKELNRDG